MATTTTAAPASPTNSRRVAILGWGGDAGPACELLEQLDLEPAVLDAVSVDKLDSLRDIGFLLLLPGQEEADADVMLGVGFMLAVLGRQRMACLVGEGDQMPPALKGATRVVIDDSGLWKLLLAREMKRAGVELDLNRAI